MYENPGIGVRKRSESVYENLRNPHLPANASDDAANELLDEIPPGRLSLDLRPDQRHEGTDEDLSNLQFFENWSRLITARAYAIVSEAVEVAANGCTAIAAANFVDAVSKNPMRTFYFDMGIYATARVAGKGVLPQIQYVTTQKANTGPPRAENPAERLASAMFESRHAQGLSLYRFERTEREWHDKGFSEWTLMPQGNALRRMTVAVWSNRDVSKKIAHGQEARVWQAILGRDAQVLRGRASSTYAAGLRDIAGEGSIEMLATMGTLAPKIFACRVLWHGLVVPSIDMGKAVAERHGAYKARGELQADDQGNIVRAIRGPEELAASV